MADSQSTGLIWFGKGRKNDSHLLSTWGSAPLTYSPDQELDEHWNADRYEIILGNDRTGELFQRAAWLTLRNQFYPREVMTAVSQFSLEDRPVRAGDRVLQRIGLLQYNTRPILEVLTMNEITEVINEPRRAGFTYTTTAAHSEMGEWSPTVEWRENGEVALIIEVVSRTRPGTTRLGQRLARQMQLRAHRLSIAHFQYLLTGRRPQIQREEPHSARQPVAVAALQGAAAVSATLLLLNLALALFRYSRQAGRR